MSRSPGGGGTRLPARATAGPLAVLTGILAGANVLTHRILPGAPAAVAAMLVFALLALVRVTGLTAAELGTARRTAPRGLRWGAAAAAVVFAAGGLVLAVPGLQDRIATSQDTWSEVAVRTLLFIPFVIVLPEELAFRGVAWALLRRSGRDRTATLVSSGLFGLWHVLPALGGGPANATVAGSFGEGPVAVAARVAGTALFTAAAGVVFCRLRAGSGSLLAPAALHWAANSAGVVLVKLSSGG
jgi:membrane protease YdiL (CAAX protease family)